jgi:hypothetical protein
MEDNASIGKKGSAGSLDEKGKSNVRPAETSFIWVILLAVIFIAAFAYMNGFFPGNKASNLCNDGTETGKCSSIQPYYCQNKTLVQGPGLCGCPETFNFSNDGGECVSNYQTGGKNISLKYVLDGEEGKINLIVYHGFANYTSKIPRSIEYIGSGKNFSRVDFKLKSINDQIQGDALSELVKEIQKITPDKNEQAKIAASIVQNIPYGYKDGKISLSKNESVIYTRYPYEVLYDNRGICGEKSQLLAFLLRELGFGTAIFYNQQENHEAVGIGCPKGESWKNSGYCFVETSAPAVISDSEIEYVGGLKIISDPEIMEISDGLSLSGKIPDYGDAKAMMRIREMIADSGKLNVYHQWRYDKLRAKYGLDGEYNLA